MLHTFANLLKILYQWVLPYHCILCGNHSKRDQDLCIDCYRALPTITSACTCCANIITLNEVLCGACLQHPPPFDTTYAAYWYKFPIAQLILDLKFRHQLIYARILGELLTEKIYRDWYQKKPLPEVIIPVPLHQNRLQKRGFNQALELARPIARRLQLPIDQTLTIRCKPTLSQAQLPAKQRKENIKHAFQVIRPTTYRYVAVIDDVITTGHTISEFCKTLKKAGIQQIDVWCCARPQKME